MVQALGSEKMKVSEASSCFRLQVQHVLMFLPFCPQYAVPVTKYDRRGYKPRHRQLLITANSAVIAEEGKLKQCIDYGALKGQRLKLDSLPGF